MKNIAILIAIASIAIVGFAPPKKESCGGCDKGKMKAESTQSPKAKKESGCSMEKGSKKGEKHECCGKDPFIMEANRMKAASEGKKSTGCACEDKAAAKKAAAKKVVLKKAAIKKLAPKEKVVKPATK